MDAISSSSDSSGAVLGQHRACGKVILLGEHFVVHGSPALALPLTSRWTEATVTGGRPGKPARLESEAKGRDLELARTILRAALRDLGVESGCGWRVAVRSEIPMGSGLGSSAALCVALAGALARAAGQPLCGLTLGQRAHELERLVHGDPSGIDDTVVALQRPIWFCRGEPAQYLEVPGDLRLVLASTGQAGATRRMVRRVQALGNRQPRRFERLLELAAEVARQGQAAIKAADGPSLGQAMDRAHGLLQELGVSTPALDTLVEAARRGGALGAKLTGSGGGGFIVALAGADREAELAAALRRQGAVQVMPLSDPRGPVPKARPVQEALA